MDSARALFKEFSESNNLTSLQESKLLDTIEVLTLKALKCDSNCASCLQMLKGVQDFKSDNHGLINTYNSLLRLYPESVLFHYERAETFLNILDTNNAKKDFKWIITKLNNEPPMDKKQAYIYYEYKYISEYFLFGPKYIIETNKRLLKQKNTTIQQIQGIENVKSRFKLDSVWNALYPLK
ncbi:MAG: hypothetical protein KG003_15630 [Bacteroidetes bacterium]|nr:hypothetical protein [Bacteroidota bacterium]